MPMVLAVCPGLVALSAAAWGQAGGLAAGTCADAIDLGQGGTGPRSQQRAGMTPASGFVSGSLAAGNSTLTLGAPLASQP